MEKIKIDELIKAQFGELGKEQKLTIEQRFFLEISNIVGKENVIIKNGEIEILGEKNIGFLNSLGPDFISNLLIKVQGQ